MGMFICKLRKENNMTQMELAQQLHVTDKAVSRWERGIGYPDIQLLPALSESLHVSVAELISCKKSLNYSNEEVTNIIHNLDVYKMESFRQDRKADKISLVCMIFVAACVYISGHGSIIGSLCIGAIFAMAVIGLYYLCCIMRIKIYNICINSSELISWVDLEQTMFRSILPFLVNGKKSWKTLPESIRLKKVKRLLF